MKFKSVLLASLLLGYSLHAETQPNTQRGEVIKKNEEQRASIELQYLQNMMPNTKIAKYKKSFVDGFFEVYFENGQIIYVNPFKEVIFVGEFLNKGGISITSSARQAWQDELTNKNIKDTNPADLIKHAKKIINNKGSQNGLAFVIFTDPECPFCQKAEDLLANADTDVYINYMPLPFHKNAENWALQALSSSDFKKANHDVRSGTTNIAITDEAKKRLEAMKSLGESLKVQGTPRLYVIDTKENRVIDVINGMRAEQIQRHINTPKG